MKCIIAFVSQIILVPYAFPHARIKLKRDQKDTSVSGIDK